MGNINTSTGRGAEKCWPEVVAVEKFKLSPKEVAAQLSPIVVLTYFNDSFTTGCPPVRGDNSRALASELSYVQVDNYGITILYHLHQCRPCTLRDISC